MLVTRLGVLVLAVAGVVVACAGGGEGPSSSSAYNPTIGGSDTEPATTTTGSDDSATSTMSAGVTSTPPPDGSCCQASPEPGCGNAETETCVCTIEPSCCQADGVWSSACVELAMSPCADPACPGGSGSTGEPSDSSGEPPPMLTCDELAAQESWMYWRCEAGGGSQCNGMGTPTTDCTFCCEYCGEPDAQSCGDVAMDNGWAAANCEWNGNGACGGSGTPTCDCAFCCEVN